MSFDFKTLKPSPCSVKKIETALRTELHTLGKRYEPGQPKDIRAELEGKSNKLLRVAQGLLAVRPGPARCAYAQRLVLLARGQLKS